MKTTEVEAHVELVCALSVCASTNDGRSLTGGTNLIGMVPVSLQVVGHA